MARTVAIAATIARVLTTNEVLVRRDAHWAPFETADMTLLPTWTPSGDGERRLSGRDGARTRGIQGAVGGKGRRPVVSERGDRPPLGDSLRGPFWQTSQRHALGGGRPLRRRHTERCGDAAEMGHMEPCRRGKSPLQAMRFEE